MSIQPRQTASTNPKMPAKITTPAGIELVQVPNWYDGNRAVYEDDRKVWRIVPQYRTPQRRPTVALVRIRDAEITRYASVRDALAAIDA